MQLAPPLPSQDGPGRPLRPWAQECADCACGSPFNRRTLAVRASGRTDLPVGGASGCPIARTRDEAQQHWQHGRPVDEQSGLELPELGHGVPVAEDRRRITNLGPGRKPTRSRNLRASWTTCGAESRVALGRASSGAGVVGEVASGRTAGVRGAVTSRSHSSLWGGPSGAPAGAGRRSEASLARIRRLGWCVGSRCFCSASASFLRRGLS